MLTFCYVTRGRAIVLTRHHVASLSTAAGRNVLPELTAMQAERWDAATLGQLMRAIRLRLGVAS